MQIDWIQHYKNKLGKISFNIEDFQKFYIETKPYIDIIMAHNPKRVIEVGSGLARDSLLLAQHGIKSTAFEIDEKLLNASKESAENLKVDLDTICGDFFNLDKYIRKDEYDIAIHLGVLEHFSNQEIVNILNQQIQLIPKIIFAVPIKSEFNDNFFLDTIYRRLLNKKDWGIILKDFNIIKMEVVRTRFDTLVVTIAR